MSVTRGKSTSINLTQMSYNNDWCNSGTYIMGLTNHFLIGFKAQSISWNPCLALLLEPRPCGETWHMTWGEPTTITKWTWCIKQSLIILLFFQRLINISSIIRETYFSNRLWLSQRPQLVKVHRIADCDMFRPSGASVLYFPLQRLRDDYRRGRKSVRSRVSWWWLDNSIYWTYQCSWRYEQWWLG